MLRRRAGRKGIKMKNIIIVIVSILFFALEIAYQIKHGTSIIRSNSDIRHPFFAKFIVFMLILFMGSLAFPIESKISPFNFEKLFLIVGICGIAGFGLAVVLGRYEDRRLYLSVVFLNVISLILRFAVEVGQESIFYNYTVMNIISYLLIMPVITIFMHRIIIKYLWG